MTAVGVERRDAGQRAVIAADVAPHRGHGHYIRRAAAALAARPSPFTCDDIRDMAKILADDDGHTFDPAPNLLPAIIGGLVSTGELVRQPLDARSGRRTRHAARVGTYLGPRYATPPPR